jgi:KTSC domain
MEHRDNSLLTVSVHVFSKWTLKPTDWQPLDSRMLAAVAYVPKTATLYLRFRSGEIYAYFDFPEALYQEFLQAESRGRYFLSHIRGRFRYQRIAQSNAT